MRKILFLLVILPGIAWGQFADSTKSVVFSEKFTLQDRKNLDEAGWALKQYTTLHYIGTGGIFAGGAIGGIGAATHNPTMMYIGIGLGATGALLHFLIPPYIAKAGNLLIKIGGL